MKIIQVAKAIGYSPEDLLNQIKAAGLSHKNVEDEISNEDKKILLNFIKSSKKSSKKTISLKVPVRDFATYDVTASAYVVSPGKYDVLVGNSSENIYYKTEVKID